jgi:hemerythrin superfamily protein
METTADSDVIAVLTTDHREVERMFAELQQLGPDQAERRQALAEQVITELVRHSVAEEAYLYPATRRFVPGGDGLADRELTEHAQAEQTMKELEGCPPDDPRFETLVRQLVQEITEHVREEEQELFPRLTANADRQELQSLGRKVEAMKKVAPTRPHPAAPDTPPMNKLAAPGAGRVDRIRDAQWPWAGALTHRPAPGQRVGAAWPGAR